MKPSRVQVVWAAVLPGPAALLDRAAPLADRIVDAHLAAHAERHQWFQGRLHTVRELAPLLARLPIDDIGRQAARLADRLEIEPGVVQHEIVPFIGLEPPPAPGRRRWRSTAPAPRAPAVPLSFDVGIVVLSLKVARAAREGRTAPVMRALVMLLSAATVAANASVSAAATATARLLHVVPPVMFVVCFESVVITARRHALARRGLLPQPLPRVRAARWILAFPSTWALWRRMVLGDTQDAAREPARGTAGEPVTSPTTSGSPATPPVPDAVAASAPAKAPHARLRSQGPAARSSTPAAQTATRATRDSEAGRLLAAHPDIAAPELARCLAAAGWPVSTRTAQRLRARLVPESTSVASRPFRNSRPNAQPLGMEAVGGSIAERAEETPKCGPLHR